MTYTSIYLSLRLEEDREHSFRASLVQETRNLVARLIPISWIQWRCSLTFSVLNRKHLFSANLVQKIKIVRWSRNLVPRLIRIFKIQWCCSLFLFYTGNPLFGKRRKTKRNYCLCDLTWVEIGTCVHLWLLLGTALKIFK